MSVPYHIAKIEFAVFTMQHPFRCRAKGELFSCFTHAMLEEYYLKNGGMVSLDPGRYAVDIKNGKLSIERLSK